MGMRTVHRDKKPSLVPPPAAAVASLVVPGFGQMLTRQVWRGLLIMGSLASIIALFIWRVNDIAHREVGVLAMVSRSLQRRPLFVVIVLIGIVLMWALNVWDAYRQAQPGKQPGTGIFILIAVVFFVLGWQISEIDLEKAVVELPDALPPLSRVLWPWEAAFTRETDTVSAEAPILSPCDDNPPPPPEEIPGEPYLVAEPTCGDLSDLDENNDVIPGTTLHLIGRGFAPNTETQIW